MVRQDGLTQSAGVVARYTAPRPLPAAASGLPAGHANAAAC